jgi:hypothetical protein
LEKRKKELTQVRNLYLGNIEMSQEAKLAYKAELQELMHPKPKHRKDLSPDFVPKKYKSYVLDKVKETDFVAKTKSMRQNYERKILHDKQVEYGREVKAIYLPRIESNAENQNAIEAIDRMVKAKYYNKVSLRKEYDKKRRLEEIQRFLKNNDANADNYESPVRVMVHNPKSINNSNLVEEGDEETKSNPGMVVKKNYIIDKSGRNTDKSPGPSHKSPINYSNHDNSYRSYEDENLGSVKPAKNSNFVPKKANAPRMTKDKREYYDPKMLNHLSNNTIDRDYYNAEDGY